MINVTIKSTELLAKLYKSFGLTWISFQSGNITHLWLIGCCMGTMSLKISCFGRLVVNTLPKYELILASFSIGTGMFCPYMHWQKCRTEPKGEFPARVSLKSFPKSSFILRFFHTCGACNTWYYAERPLVLL